MYNYTQKQPLASFVLTLSKPPPARLSRSALVYIPAIDLLPAGKYPQICGNILPRDTKTKPIGGTPKLVSPQEIIKISSKMPTWYGLGHKSILRGRYKIERCQIWTTHEEQF